MIVSTSELMYDEYILFINNYSLLLRKMPHRSDIIDLIDVKFLSHTLGIIKRGAMERFWIWIWTTQNENHIPNNILITTHMTIL